MYNNYNNEEATVCVNNTCATVRGDTAKFVNGLVVLTVTLSTIALIVKALK